VKTNFDLSNEKREEMTNIIQDYVQREHSEHFGNLEAMLLLDFFIKKLAPSFYNMGVEDSHTYMTDKLDDIFEIEKSIPE